MRAGRAWSRRRCPVSWGSWWNMGHAAPPTAAAPFGAGDLVVVDLPHPGRRVSGGGIAGQGDPDGAVGVVGHQRRVLQTEVGAEVGELGAGTPVEDQGPADGGDDDVVVARRRESAVTTEPMTRPRPPPSRSVWPVAAFSTHTEPEPPDLVGPLDHLERPVPEDVGEGGGREGAAVQRWPTTAAGSGCCRPSRCWCRRPRGRRRRCRPRSRWPRRGGIPPTAGDESTT